MITDKKFDKCEQGCPKDALFCTSKLYSVSNNRII